MPISATESNIMLNKQKLVNTESLIIQRKTSNFYNRISSPDYMNKINLYYFDVKQYNNIFKNSTFIS